MEHHINHFLKKTQETYDYLIGKGEYTVATSILRNASTMAELSLRLAGIQPHKVICPTCKHQLKKGTEIEFFNHIGECRNCDSIRSDIQYEQD